MSRGSFSRTVARAAASGGSRAYRGKSPKAWYALIAAICALGLFLIVYSRNERLHPYVAPAVHPTASDHWYAALAVDLCGKLQPNLPANPNFSSVGIRTAGDGVILVAPGAVSNSSAYTGKKATLGTFVLSYPGFSLTSRSIQLPGGKAFVDGQSCTPAVGPARGKASLSLETWSSPKAKGRPYSGDPAKLELANGMMLTVGFVPAGTKLPVPPSRAALLGDLNGTAVSAPPTTPTTSSSTTSSTLAKKAKAGANAATSTSGASSTATSSTVPPSTARPSKVTPSTARPSAVTPSTTRPAAAGAATH